MKPDRVLGPAPLGGLPGTAAFFSAAPLPDLPPANCYKPVTHKDARAVYNF